MHYKIFPGESKKNGNTFEWSYKIPKDQASGDYPIVEIRVTIDRESPIVLSYGPAEFPARTFKIENSRTIIKPAIKDVKELSKQ